MSDKPVYWCPIRCQFYWIEWLDGGNNDIPKRHYINLSTAVGPVAISD